METGATVFTARYLYPAVQCTTTVISLIFGAVAVCCAGLRAGAPTRDTESLDSFDTTVRLLLQYDAAFTRDW